MHARIIENLKRSTIALALVAVVVAVAAGAASATTSARLPSVAYMLRADLTSAQVVPALSTPAPQARGTFVAALIRTPAARGRRGEAGPFVWRLVWRLTYSGLTGAPTAIELHTGAPGHVGPEIQPLCTSCGGVMPHGTINNLAPTDARALLSGQGYVVVDTAANPNGEIRGQIQRVRPVLGIRHLQRP